MACRATDDLTHSLLLEQSLAAYVDGDVSTSEPFLALTRLMQNSVVVRGAHLSILRKLASPAYVRIHTNVIAWTIKKAAALEDTQQSAAKDRAALAFRGLANIVAGLNGKEALAM